jgi:adenylyltransferase/sulfurtransferase
MLTEDELQRYNRQMLLAGWGERGQARLKQSTVFIAGAGGLGSPVSIYLAAAGVGTLRICDCDVVDLTNLNRQILHNHMRVGQPKAASARETLALVNPCTNVDALTDRINPDTVDRLVGNASLIIDCMDNFTARYALNDAAIRRRIPLIFGAVWGMEGRLSVLFPPATPCLRCLYPESPPQEKFPVVGVTAGTIGCLQAAEALKYLTGVGTPLNNRLLVWDGSAMTFRQFKIRRDPSCPSCSTLKTV